MGIKSIGSHESQQKIKVPANIAIIMSLTPVVLFSKSIPIGLHYLLM